MPKIKTLGNIIAYREMMFISDNGKEEKAYLEVGEPFEYNEDKDWCCPYELSTESRSKVFGMIGIDSIQALELTMKTLSVEIQYWEKSQKGKFYFLKEEGAGI